MTKQPDGQRLTGSVGTSVLLHFTSSLDALLSILTQCFHAHYCPEDLNAVIPDLDFPNSEILQAAIPMVCFCDVPLSQARRHFDAYGRYGIGLTKSWGLKSGLSPVLYAHPRSSSTLHLFKVGARSHRIGQRNDSALKAFWREIESDFDNIFAYVKPYEGRLWRGGTWVDGVRFYDEREWRWVPNGDGAEWLARAEWQNPETLAQAQRDLEQKFVLPFRTTDTRYLIVSEEHEIPQLLHSLQDRSSGLDAEALRILSSRIISAEQILADF